MWGVAAKAARVTGFGVGTEELVETGRANEASLRRMLNMDCKGINKDGSGIQRGKGIKVKNGHGVCKGASRVTPQVCHRSAEAAIQGTRTAAFQSSGLRTQVAGPSGHRGRSRPWSQLTGQKGTEFSGGSGFRQNSRLKARIRKVSL